MSLTEMKFVEFTPASKDEWLQLRTKDVTSTEVSALFNLSPYATEFEIWHRKKEGTILEIESNDRMIWGTRLEASIASGIAEDRGWEIRPMKEYCRLAELRMGSSFDYEIPSENAILEIKNVDSLMFDRSWEQDGIEILAPAHIELQVQHQLAVTGKEKAFIGVLVGGNRLEVLERPRNESVILKIKDRVAAFWKSIDDNRPPEPNFVKDAEFIVSLYQSASKGKVLDGQQDESLTEKAEQYLKLGGEIKTLIEQRDAIKAEILMKIEDAEKVVGQGFTISAGVIAGGHVEFDREPYRNFKINLKKVRPI